jgi:hypothetical protein
MDDARMPDERKLHRFPPVIHQRASPCTLRSLAMRHIVRLKRIDSFLRCTAVYHHIVCFDMLLFLHCTKTRKGGARWLPSGLRGGWQGEARCAEDLGWMGGGALAEG